MSVAPRVLLVEDDRFLRRACEASLRQRGFDVTTANDGEEGLRLARAAPRADIILLDLLMPKMPGIEVLRALKAEPETAAIPVLILSNSSREDDRQQALQLGAAGYYVKANLSLRELAVQVDQMVNAMPPVDMARLRDFSDGTDAGVRQLADMFVSHMTECLEGLRVAAESGNKSVLRAEAHRWAGTAGACGARALAELLRQLEALDPADDSDAARLVSAIAAELAKVRSFLHAIFADASGTAPDAEVPG
jgi:CheY-like chemotaxis protein